MPQWVTFAGVTGVVLTLLILLSRTSQGLVEPSTPRESEPRNRATGAATIEPADDPGSIDDTGEVSPVKPERSLSSGMLLLNVAFTQGVFGVIVAASAWFARIPAPALGLADPFDAALLLVGVGFGVALYVADEAMAVAAEGVGIEYAEELREMLAPDSVGGWLVLLGVVLPVIALFEELLFRAALIGALSAGFGVSPWLLAVASTALFALGHGAQGRAGILVTGALGFVLAAAFIVTESFVVVVVAHYLVNALEFLVHEGPGIERGRTTGTGE